MCILLYPIHTAISLFLVYPQSCEVSFRSETSPFRMNNLLRSSPRRTPRSLRTSTEAKHVELRLGKYRLRDYRQTCLLTTSLVNSSTIRGFEMPSLRRLYNIQLLANELMPLNNLMPFCVMIRRSCPAALVERAIHMNHTKALIKR